MNVQPTILAEILKAKRPRVGKSKKGFDYTDFVRHARDAGRNHSGGRFLKSLENGAGPAIIAEFKRAMPGSGIFDEKADAGATAQIYENSGAAAISVVTEQDFFRGSVEDLIAARNLTELPVLRRDFVFDEFQVYETALIAADAILLIAAVLDDEKLGGLQSLAHDLGLDVVIAAHNREEVERAGSIGAKIICVTNRDPHTFELSADVSGELIKHSPSQAIMIAESGLKTGKRLKALGERGFKGVLFTETLNEVTEIRDMPGSLRK